MALLYDEVKGEGLTLDDILQLPVENSKVVEIDAIIKSKITGNVYHLEAKNLEYLERGKEGAAFRLKPEGKEDKREYDIVKRMIVEHLESRPYPKGVPSTVEKKIREGDYRLPTFDHHDIARVCQIISSCGFEVTYNLKSVNVPYELLQRENIPKGKLTYSS